jgi:FG-GAP-like repeat/FG-GAP repeat
MQSGDMKKLLHRIGYRRLKLNRNQITMKSRIQNLFLLLALFTGGCKAQDFVITSSPRVGKQPVSVCAGDVNGDGKMDLICANYGDNTLTVLTNNGSGSFATSGIYGVGNKPASVCAADVNGDGKMDLICADYGDNTLTVLTNNGSGGFGSNATYKVGSGPKSLCAADVTGDGKGKVDLICANYDGDTLTVLTNNGSGGFVIASSPRVGRHPQSISAAYISTQSYEPGHVKLGLICAAGGNHFLELVNAGNGCFYGGLSPNELSKDFYNDRFNGDPDNDDPQSVFAAGVNTDAGSDGSLVLISADCGRTPMKNLRYDGWPYIGTIQMSKNTGGGYLMDPHSGGVSGIFQGILYCICAADVNGDDKVDLICANWADNTLTVFTNSGVTSDFVLASKNKVGEHIKCVCAADVNGDGKMDLICANYNDGTLTVLINNIAFPPPKH